MFTCEVENKKGDILTLTQAEKEFQVISIEGLDPPNAMINISSMASLDGGKFNSSRLEARNIVISLKINGDAESNRIRLYTFFNPKEYCKIYYKNGKRNVFIEGYVETNECTIFEQKETMQISIICPSPYFSELDEMYYDISKILACFTFPFAIDFDNPIPFSILDMERLTNVFNTSEADSGVMIEISFDAPVGRIQINNVSTGERFILNYSFVAYDKVFINTIPGQKSVTLLRDGKERNLLTAMEKGSRFFKLTVGDNLFSYLADDGESDIFVTVVFRYHVLYSGV